MEEEKKENQSNSTNLEKKPLNTIIFIEDLNKKFKYTFKGMQIFLSILLIF